MWMSADQGNILYRIEANKCILAVFSRSGKYPIVMTMDETRRFR